MKKRRERRRRKTFLSNVIGKISPTRYAAASWQSEYLQRARSRNCATTRQCDIKKALSSPSINFFDSLTSTINTHNIMATLTLDRLLSTAASSSSSKFPFTDRMPPELRNKIFKLCFPTNTTVYPSVDLWGFPTRHEDGVKTALSLARTCHKIRTEVIPLYCGSNMFSFTASFQMHKFLVSYLVALS